MTWAAGINIHLHRQDIDRMKLVKWNQSEVDIIYIIVLNWEWPCNRGYQYLTAGDTFAICITLAPGRAIPTWIFLSISHYNPICIRHEPMNSVMIQRAILWKLILTPERRELLGFWYIAIFFMSFLATVSIKISDYLEQHKEVINEICCTILYASLPLSSATAQNNDGTSAIAIVLLYITNSYRTRLSRVNDIYTLKTYKKAI